MKSEPGLDGLANDVDSLIIRQLQGAASDLEERRLAAWRDAAPANEAHYRGVVRLWAVGSVLCQTVPADAPAPTIGELAARTTPAFRRRVQLPGRRTSWRRRGLAAAALFLLGFAASRAALVGRSDSPLGAGEFVTNAAETVTVTLGDGTIVRLAPQSRLRLTGGRGRDVWLDGRAYFAVAPQPGARFRVRTHAGDAVVLGTRFDLQARGGDMRVLVVEGRVEVGAPAGRLAVGASELASVVSGAAPVSERVDPSYLRRELSWVGDFLVFTATPLSQVARELSDHYGVPVEVLDSTLANETVHGWFSSGELADVLGVVCRAVRAHCVVQPTGATIAP